MRINISIRKQVLHEAGYYCSNPSCRVPITLDIHHIVAVAKNGKDEPANLLALCPNCHRRHHSGDIPEDSIRAWKMFQIQINESIGIPSLQMLLTISKFDRLSVSGDGILQCSPLIANGYVDFLGLRNRQDKAEYWVKISNKGVLFLEAWKRGDQSSIVIDSFRSESSD